MHANCDHWPSLMFSAPQVITNVDEARSSPPTKLTNVMASLLHFYKAHQSNVMATLLHFNAGSPQLLHTEWMSTTTHTHFKDLNSSIK